MDREDDIRQWIDMHEEELVRISEAGENPQCLAAGTGAVR